MTDEDRRKALKAMAWAVPIVALTVSTPLAAASVPPDCNRIKFANVTATVGGKPNTLYVNTKVQVIDGPAAVERLTLVVSLSRNGQTVTKLWPHIAGWQSTEQVYLEFPDIPKGDPVTVSFAAFAPGVIAIGASVKVETPSWWA